MRKIEATLPTLGFVPLSFHSETEDILDFFGDEELERLNDVDHLGPASTAFTGVNHTRLEYALLQCALVQQVGLLFKHDHDLGISSPVQVDGLNGKVSSGEELLKAWVLLAAVGRPRWTFGAERALMQAALRDTSVARWLIPTRITDLRQWCHQQVFRYHDWNAHYLISVRRFAYGAPYDRRKTRFAHLLRNRVLPIQSLLEDNPEARRKLSKLRRLSTRIRLLTIATLDSYYSHRPVKIDLHSSLATLKEVAGDSADARRLEAVLTSIAGWLGDDLYFHPEAVAIEKAYERRALPRLAARLRASEKSDDAREAMFKELMESGLGRPLRGLSPLWRVTLSAKVARDLSVRPHPAVSDHLRNQLCDLPRTDLAVNHNPFADTVHFDLLYRPGQASVSDVTSALINTVFAVLSRLRIQTLKRYKNTYPPLLRKRPGVRTFATRAFQREIEQLQDGLAGLFEAVLKYLIPRHHTIEFVPQLPSEDTGPRVRLKLRERAGLGLDQLSRFLDEQIATNPLGLEADRIHELVGLQRLVKRAEAPIVVAAVEPAMIYNEHGRRIDEWDAVLLEIGEEELVCHIFEGKRTMRRRENAAFDQLGATRDLVKDRVSSYERKRMSKLGCRLSLTLELTAKAD